MAPAERGIVTGEEPSRAVTTPVGPLRRTAERADLGCSRPSQFAAVVAHGADAAPQLSVVLPVHDEAETLPELHRRLAVALTGVGDYELIFVDDGSRDTSAAIVASLASGDPRVKLLRLSRNFGHQAAMAAGLDHATGAAVVLMDADLQDPPEVIAGMVDAWRSGADVVYAVREARKEGPLKRACYHLFYRLVRALSAPLDIPLDSGDFCLLDRRVVDAIVALAEQKTFLRGLRTWVGFRQVPLRYERHARHAGQPKYTFAKLRKLATDGIIACSSRPLRLASYLGFATLAVAMAYLATVLGWFFLRGTAPAGWTSLVGVVLLLGGAQLLVLGVLSEYVARIFDETRRRPDYLIAAAIGFAAHDRDDAPNRCGADAHDGDHAPNRSRADAHDHDHDHNGDPRGAVSRAEPRPRRGPLATRPEPRLPAPRPVPDGHRLKEPPMSASVPDRPTPGGVSARPAADDAAPTPAAGGFPAHVEDLSASVVLPFEGADWYDLAGADHFWMRWRMTEALSLADRAGIERDAALAVMDVGGGIGTVRGQLEAQTRWTVDLAELDPTALHHGQPGRGRTLHYDVTERAAALEAAYDVVVLFDVLEHVADTAPFVDALLWHLKPGGHLLVNVPALPRGHSRYDEAAGHVRRYTRASLVAELARDSASVVEARYWGMGLVPLLFARKAWLASTARRAGTEEVLRAGFKAPGPIGSGLLALLCRTETGLLGRAPIGTSLLAAVRRDD